jgi:hypothetical protein
MKNFAGILNALGLGPGNTGPISIGDDPPLSVRYHPAGGGYAASLIFELNAQVHITIYQNSWDGAYYPVQDCTGDDVSVGPDCLHTTAGQERWFRQFEAGTWTWVTDCGTPARRYLLSFQAMMNTMEPYLS